MFRHPCNLSIILTVITIGIRMLTDTDEKFLRLAYQEAKDGFDEGGAVQ